MGKWKKWYTGLVESRKGRQLEEGVYYENHHILPKSMGGSDDPDNLVWLTPKEHFIAHLLLVKWSSGQAKYKMKFALNMMMVSGSDHKGQRYIPNSRTYHFVRTCLSEAWSEVKKGKPAWNRGIPRTDEVKQAVSEANKGKEAWNKGSKRSEEDKQKMKEGWARRKAEGHTPWNKGNKSHG